MAPQWFHDALKTYIQRLKDDLKKDTAESIKKVERRLEIVETRFKDDLGRVKDEVVPGVRVVSDI